MFSRSVFGFLEGGGGGLFLSVVHDLVYVSAVQQLYEAERGAEN